MAYTDPSSLAFATNENPLASAKLNNATNEQFLALFPDDETTASWSPTLESTGTNPTTSSVDGAQYRIGALQFFWARFVIDTPGTGTYVVALPRASTGVTKSSSSGSGSNIGGWHARDDSAGGTSAAGALFVDAADQARFVIADPDTSHKIVTADQPWTFASGDVISLSGFYPIA